MSRGVHLSLRVAAAVTFSTAIGFLVAALFWQICRGLPAKTAVFTCIGVLSILVTAIYASVSAGAELNWKAVSTGSAVGALGMGGWWMSQSNLLSPLPHTFVVPLMFSGVAAAATVENYSSRSRKTRQFYRTSGFVSVVHLLQGVFLFGVVLPGCIAWKWPRPFAAALIGSAFVLWELWGGCPLTMAENKLRVREGRAIIPPEEGFIKDVLDHWGIPVWGNTIAAVLHGIGFCLCSWWGIEWLMSLFRHG
jgi:Protein of Unknown function (DUF2784)